MGSVPHVDGDDLALIIGADESVVREVAGELEAGDGFPREDGVVVAAPLLGRLGLEACVDDDDDPHGVSFCGLSWPRCGFRS